jgi:hypothetical protein
MFDVLKPPTDNLYKFIALTGLLVLIVSVVLQAYALVTMEMKRLEVVRELNKTNATLSEAKGLGEEPEGAKHDANAASVKLDAAVARYKAMPKSKHPSRQEATEQLRRLDEIEAASQRLRDASKELQSKAEELGRKTAEAHTRSIETEYQNEVLETINLGFVLSKILLLIGSLVGIVIALLGFVLWYRKVQLFEERVIRKNCQGSFITTGRFRLTLAADAR